MYNTRQLGHTHIYICLIWLYFRGKSSGHDVDILITHPVESKVNGVLPHLLESLRSTDAVLYGNLERSSYSDEVLTTNSKLSMRGQLDHFEKWIGIIKVPKCVRDVDNIAKCSANEFNIQSKSDNTLIDHKQGCTSDADGDHELLQKDKGDSDFVDATATDQNEARDTSVQSLNQSLDEPLNVKCPDNPIELAQEERTWTARRVDLIVSPYSQYYYALVGWIGSKQFNRDVRTYADREMKMKLTSHGLYNFTLVSLCEALFTLYKIRTCICTR